MNIWYVRWKFISHQKNTISDFVLFALVVKEFIDSKYGENRGYEKIDFNGMSTCLGLLYAKRLGNLILLYIHIYIFHVVASSEVVGKWSDQIQKFF